MADLGRLMTWSVSKELRRTYQNDILKHYYDIVKSIAGDKFAANFAQMKEWYDIHFAQNVVWAMSVTTGMFLETLPRGLGEQKKKDQLIFLDRLRAAYEDTLLIVGDQI